MLKLVVLVEVRRTMSNVVDQLARLCESYRSLESKLEYARVHIIEHLDVIPLKTIKCLYYDEILYYEDMPDEILDKLSEFDDLMARGIERYRSSRGRANVN